MDLVIFCAFCFKNTAPLYWLLRLISMATYKCVKFFIWVSIYTKSRPARLLSRYATCKIVVFLTERHNSNRKLWCLSYTKEWEMPEALPEIRSPRNNLYFPSRIEDLYAWGTNQDCQVGLPACTYHTNSIFWCCPSTLLQVDSERPKGPKKDYTTN